MTIGTGSTPAISVIICTVNRRRCLIRLLESLMECHPLPGQIVVSGWCEDATARDLVFEYQPRFGQKGIALTWVGGGLGLTVQRNAGVRASRGQALLFLDDDTTVSSSIFAELAKALAAEGTSNAVGFGLVIDEPGKMGAVFGGGAYDDWGRPRHCKAEAFTKLDFLCGCAMYRREVFDQLSFAELFSGYAQGEDRLFSGLVSKIGRLSVAENARVIHWADGDGRPAGFAKGVGVGRNHAIIAAVMLRFRGNPKPLWGALRILPGGVLRSLVELLSFRGASALMHVGRSIGVLLGLIVGFVAPKRLIGIRPVAHSDTG